MSNMALSDQMAKGRGEGRQKPAISRNMLRKNMPLETIVEVTGLTIAQLQQLQANQP